LSLPNDFSSINKNKIKTEGISTIIVKKTSKNPFIFRGKKK
jgi:hypothetical protein